MIALNPKQLQSQMNPIPQSEIPSCRIMRLALPPNSTLSWLHPTHSSTHIALASIPNSHPQLIHFNQEGTILNHLKLEDGAEYRVTVLCQWEVLVFQRQKAKGHEAKGEIVRVFVWEFANNDLRQVMEEPLHNQVSEFQLFTFQDTNIFCIVQEIFNQNSPMLGYQWYQPTSISVWYYLVTPSKQYPDPSAIALLSQTTHLASHEEISFRDFHVVQINNHSAIGIVNRSKTMLSRDWVRVLELISQEGEGEEKGKLEVVENQLEFTKTPRNYLGFAGLTDIWELGVQGRPALYLKFDNVGGDRQFSCVWDYLEDELVYNQVREGLNFHEQILGNFRPLHQMKKSWQNEQQLPQLPIQILSQVNNKPERIGKHYFPPPTPSSRRKVNWRSTGSQWYQHDLVSQTVIIWKIDYTNIVFNTREMVAFMLLQTIGEEAEDDLVEAVADALMHGQAQDHGQAQGQHGQAQGCAFKTIVQENSV